MILPVGDLGKTRRVPFINWLLILANLVVFAVMAFRPEVDPEQVYARYALVPDQWTVKTIFSSMFLHGGLEHLLGNMLFIYIAGDNVEDRLGHLEYLVFYLLSGLGAAAAQVLIDPSSTIPMVGASGAIAGVMGAYLIFFPGVQVRFILWLIIFVRTFTLPSWGVIGAWVASQILMARNQWHHTADKEATLVAVFAHLGGCAFGILVALGARLFGKQPKRKRD